MLKQVPIIGLNTHKLLMTNTLPLVVTCISISGFVGLVVACWPLEPKFAGYKPGRIRRIFKGEKNPQRTFLQKGSKAVGSMS
jgi:hypothetical protein